MDAERTSVPVGWETRKRAELIAKLDSVVQELDDWNSAVGRDETMQRHWSQVSTIVADLRPLVDVVAADVRSTDIAAHWLQLETRVLDLHRVWGFFRDKLLLRRLGFEPYLLMADEFAYACYEPARLAAVAAGDHTAAARREPPLVYLGLAASPFSLARGSSIAGEMGRDGLVTSAARAVVNALPVPVIGVPWFQLRHLPDAMIIAHEVGHLVLADFVGIDEVEGVVESELADRDDVDVERWLDWAQESFADVYGTLCGGAAYAAALADFLLVNDAEREPRQPGYPRPSARMALAASVLEVVGCAAEGGRLVGGDADARLSEAPDTSVEQARSVGRALATARFEAFGKKLSDVIDCRFQCQTGTQPVDLLQGYAPEAQDIRTLLAVTVEAFATNPEQFTKPVADLVLQRARQIHRPGRRARIETQTPTAVTARTNRTTELYQLLTET